jgi:hypothetical protein
MNHLDEPAVQQRAQPVGPPGLNRKSLVRFGVMLATALALVGLGYGLATWTQGPTQPAAKASPNADSLIAKLGCESIGTDIQSVASQYTVAYLQTSLPCPADDVVTFATEANENSWLTAYSAASVSEDSCANAVIGNLWVAPYTNGNGGPQDIQSAIGGKDWSGGC